MRAITNCRHSKDVVANNTNKKAPTTNENRELAEYKNSRSDKPNQRISLTESPEARAFKRRQNKLKRK